MMYQIFRNPATSQLAAPSLPSSMCTGVLVKGADRMVAVKLTPLRITPFAPTPWSPVAQLCTMLAGRLDLEACLYMGAKVLPFPVRGNAARRS